MARRLALILLALILPGIAAAQTPMKPRVIEFGSPGPAMQKTLSDPVMRAVVSYRISPDAHNSGGPAGASPSISSGTLTIDAGVKHYHYELSDVLPMLTDRIVLPSGPSDGCGAAEALSHRGHYLVIEAVLAEKGCAPMAVFVDLRNGAVANEVVYNPTWVHRFDPHPERLTGELLNVTDTEDITAVAARFKGDSRTSKPAPWHFTVVHAIDHQHMPKAYVIDLDSFINVDRAAVAISPGSHIFVGPFNPVEEPLLVAYFFGEQTLRPGVADEARYDALQTPTPPDRERYARRNLWFDEADHAADRGQFDAAIDAWAKMLSYETNDELYNGESDQLQACRELQRRVHAGAVTARAAAATFPNGCKLPASLPSQTPKPPS